MNLKFFVTGGTIDCDKVQGKEYVFSKSHLPYMLLQSRLKETSIEVEIEELMLKDSLYITDDDREFIVKKCRDEMTSRIVLLHGTDTMHKTAKALTESIPPSSGKTIVLLGSSIPFVKENSDAMFNLGAAVMAVQMLPPSVYVAMNGELFRGDNVQKNKVKKIFERKY